MEKKSKSNIFIDKISKLLDEAGVSNAIIIAQVEDEGICCSIGDVHENAHLLYDAMNREKDISKAYTGVADVIIENAMAGAMENNLHTKKKIVN